MKIINFIGGDWKKMLGTKAEFTLAQLLKVQKEQDAIRATAKPDCELCQGTGTMYLPDGEDDVIGETCDCLTPRKHYV